MNKNPKMIIGVGVVAVAGYLLWKQSQKKSFANLTSRTAKTAMDKTCPCKKVTGTVTTTTGAELDVCGDKHLCPKGLTNIF